MFKDMVDAEFMCIYCEVPVDARGCVQCNEYDGIRRMDGSFPLKDEYNEYFDEEYEVLCDCE